MKRKGVFSIISALIIILFISCSGSVSSSSNTYTVTFDENGHGTAPSSQTVTAGSLVTEPEDLEAENYVFCGWYREKACSTLWDFDTDTVTGDLTLYAGWSLTYDNLGHWLESGDYEEHTFPDYYTICDQTEGTLCRKCESCSYTEYYDSVECPSGKTVYTLTVYKPDEYTGETTADFTLSSGSSTSKDIYYSEEADEEEEETKSTTDTTWTLYHLFKDKSGKYTTYDAELWMSLESTDPDILFYREEGTEEDSVTVDVETSTGSSAGEKTFDISGFWSDIESGLEDAFSTDWLYKERELFDMDLWDVDSDGNFRIVFEDMNSDKVSFVKSGTSTYSLSGLAGAYYSGNTYVSESGQTVENSCNADVFYANVLYYKLYYLMTGKSSCVKSLVSTLIHEYMHYLRDSAYKDYGNNRSAVSSDGLFFEEGLANYASYAVYGTSESNHVANWLSYMDSTRPALTLTDTSAYSDTVSVNYGGAAMFFAYIADTYGQDTINSLAKNTETLDLNEKVLSVMDDSFSSIYEDYLVAFMDQLDSDSDDETFWDLFGGVTLDSLDTILKSKSYVIKKSSQSLSCSDVSELGFVIAKWSKNPSLITYNEEVDGVTTYIFFK